MEIVKAHQLDGINGNGQFGWEDKAYSVAISIKQYIYVIGESSKEMCPTAAMVDQGFSEAEILAELARRNPGPKRKAKS